MARSFPLARTVHLIALAFITVPSNFGNCASFFGFNTFTAIAVAASTTMGVTMGDCAPAATQLAVASATAARNRLATYFDEILIPCRLWQSAMTSESEHLAESS